MRAWFKHLTDHEYELGLFVLMLVIAGVVACALLWTSSGVLSTMWRLTLEVVEPLAYGAMLSYAFNPVVVHISHALKRSSRLADKGMQRRTIAAFITMAIIALVVLGMLVGFALMVSHGISGITSFRWSMVDELISSASNDIAGFIEMVKERLSGLGINFDADAGSSGNMLLSAAINVKDAVTTIVFSAIFMAYFLIDGERLSKYFHRVMRNIVGSRSVDTKRLMDDADRVFSAYFRGQALDAVVVGTLSGVLLTVVGVPYAPVVGLMTGLGNLVPYLGGPIGFGTVALVCFADKAWGTMIAGLIVMGIVMFVDGNIINPKLLSNSVEVHPMLVMVALIAGGAVGGIAGMLIAVPVAAWLKIQIDYWMDKNEESGGNLVDEIRHKNSDAKDGE